MIEHRDRRLAGIDQLIIHINLHKHKEYEGEFGFV